MSRKRSAKKALSGDSTTAHANATGGKATILSQAFQACLQLLKTLQEKPDAVPFLEPVDYEFYGLMDYPEVIKHPMDMSTVQGKLERGQYADADAFARDMRLIFENAQIYNRSDSEIYMTADKMKKLFDRKFAKLKPAETTTAAAAATGAGAAAGAGPAAAAAQATAGTAASGSKAGGGPSASAAKRRKTGSVSGTNANSNAQTGAVLGSSGSAKAPGGGNAPGTATGTATGGTTKGKVSRQDRVKFGQLVVQLASHELGTLVDMMQQQCPAALNEEDEYELEIEINNIDGGTLMSLISYCNTCLANARAKAEADQKRK